MNRLKEYEAKTKPVADFYEKKGLHVKVNGTGDIKAISQSVIAEIDKRK
jgi:adenylate kinase family enzyme